MNVFAAARVFVAACLLAAVAGAEPSPESPAPMVAEIRFETAAAIDRAAYQRYLPLQEGAPFSTTKLDESLEWLRQKKIFESVRAEAEVREGQAYVSFQLDPLPFVVGVWIANPGAIDADTLLRRARIREDEPLTSERLDDARQRLIDLYAERGYPHAEVTIAPGVVRPGQVDVAVRVEEGAPVRVAGIILDGLDVENEKAARGALRVHSGTVLEKETVSNERRTLLRLFRERGFHEVEIDATQADGDDGVALRFEIRLGPQFELTVVGNDHIPRSELLGLTDLSERPVVTAGTWQLMAIRMQEHYRERGYFFADVRAVVSREGPRTVRFEVHEGVLVRVRAVRFSGCRAISEGDLLERMQVRPRRRFDLFRSSSDVFRQDALEDDLETIRERYREHGYLQANVEEGPREFSQDQRWVTLTLAVTEGRQTVAGAVAVEGAEMLDDPARGLAMRPGQPLRAADVESDRKSLGKRLGKLGFADARVSVTNEPIAAEPQPDVDLVKVRYLVEPGRAVRIRHIIVQGNYFTRDSVVRDTLPFGSGDALDPDQLAAAQTDIYRLGLFRSAAIRPLQTSGDARDVAVEVGERPGGELLYGFGYDTRAGLRNFLQLAHNNLAGSGDRLSLRGDLNLAPHDFVPDEYIASLDGRRPYLFGSRTALKAHAGYQQSQRSVDEFSIRRASFSVGLDREWFRGLRTSLSLDLEDSDIYDVAPDAVLTGQDVGRLRTVTLNPIVLYDGRDDAFRPTRGVFDSLRIRYGSPPLGSDVHFYKLVAQHSQYVPIGPLTWIYSGRAGYAQALGGSTVIPLSERFFLGGRTSVRGFDENEIGPRGDDGDPIGGDILVNFNTELRFPLFLGLGGAVFVDGGALYLHDRAISLGDFRESAGPGLRYQTPVGSISLDYGFKLDRRDGESIGEIHFTIGNIF